MPTVHADCQANVDGEEIYRVPWPVGSPVREDLPVDAVLRVSLEFPPRNSFDIFRRDRRSRWITRILSIFFLSLFLSPEEFSFSRKKILLFEILRVYACSVARRGVSKK